MKCATHCIQYTPMLMNVPLFVLWATHLSTCSCSIPFLTDTSTSTLSQSVIFITTTKWKARTGKTPQRPGLQNVLYAQVSEPQSYPTVHRASVTAGQKSSWCCGCSLPYMEKQTKYSFDEMTPDKRDYQVPTHLQTLVMNPGSMLFDFSNDGPMHFPSFTLGSKVSSVL